MPSLQASPTKIPCRSGPQITLYGHLHLDLLWTLCPLGLGPHCETCKHVCREPSTCGPRRAKGCSIARNWKLLNAISSPLGTPQGGCVWEELCVKCVMLGGGGSDRASGDVEVWCPRHSASLRGKDHCCLFLPQRTDGFAITGF